MLKNATEQQRACRRHNYHETSKLTANFSGQREQLGYWFRCKYCGHEIFGQLTRRER